MPSRTLQHRMSPKVAVAVVFVASMFMAIMDTTIVNVALPAIGADFGLGTTRLGGINIGYLVALAVFIPMSGWLGDRFGTRRVFLTALVIFTVASALCATAVGLEQLTVFRIMQGVGGGILTPVGLTMLFRAYPPAERLKAQRPLMLTTAVAPALGPVLGGWLVDFASWHWVFLVNVPIGAAAFVFGLLFLPDYRVPEPGRFDFVGFLLAAGGFAAVLYALSEGSAKGWTTPGILGPLLGGIVVLAAMVVVERRIAMPMLNLDVLRDKLFRASNLVLFAMTAAFMAVLYLYPQLLQDQLGYSALRSGLYTFPEAIGVMTASQVVPRLYVRVGPRRLMAGGALVMAACIVLMAGFGLTTALPYSIAVLYVLGIAVGHVIMSAQNAAYANIEPMILGRASTLFNMNRQLAGAFGVAVVGTVLATAGGSARNASDGTSAYHITFLVIAGIALMAAVLTYFIDDNEARRPLADKAGSDRLTAANEPVI